MVERACMTGIVEENSRNHGNTGSSKHRRRRITFVLNYFSILGEGEKPSSLTFIELEVRD
jgi:hypothetical protein